MRKVVKLIIVLFICTFLNMNVVFASTNTKVRSEDDYLVSSNINITDENKDDILLTPAVDASEKIYDFADLFTDEEEVLLYNKVIQYINSYQMDLAIVTIDTNNKANARSYADDFYDYNDFGNNDSRDGLLFLIDMQNREIYMTTTGSAINMYNDYRIEQALDAVYSYMSDEEYYSGVVDYIDIISNYADDGLPTSNSDDDGNSMLGKLFFSFVISAIVTAIVMSILIGKNKLARKATTAREYLKKDSIDIHRDEIFIGTNTVKHKIETSSGSSGGSSTHISSSGSSHGGGGHGF